MLNVISQVSKSAPNLFLNAPGWNQWGKNVSPKKYVKPCLRTANRDYGWKHSPGCRVVLRPHADVFVQVVRPQDGGVSRQVLKVVHDDGDEQVQHLEDASNKWMLGPELGWCWIFNLDICFYSVHSKKEKKLFTLSILNVWVFLLSC